MNASVRRISLFSLVLVGFFVSCTDSIILPLGNDSGNLSTLKPNVGVLTPDFSASVYEYNVYVADSVSSIIFEAGAELPGTSIEAGTNAEYNLNRGENVIIISLKATNDTKTAYNIHVWRGHSSALKSLVPSEGTLIPEFTTNIQSYTMTLPYTTENLRFAFEADDTAAKTSENASSLQKLAVGKTTIDITVTAADGTASIYSVVIERASPDFTGTWGDPDGKYWVLGADGTVRTETHKGTWTQTTNRISFHFTEYLNDGKWYPDHYDEEKNAVLFDGKLYLDADMYLFTREEAGTSPLGTFSRIGQGLVTGLPPSVWAKERVSLLEGSHIRYEVFTSADYTPENTSVDWGTALTVLNGTGTIPDLETVVGRLITLDLSGITPATPTFPDGKYPFVFYDNNRLSINNAAQSPFVYAEKPVIDSLGLEMYNKNLPGTWYFLGSGSIPDGYGNLAEWSTSRLLISASKKTAGFYGQAGKNYATWDKDTCGQQGTIESVSTASFQMRITYDEDEPDIVGNLNTVLWRIEGEKLQIWWTDAPDGNLVPYDWRYYIEYSKTDPRPD